MTSRRRSTRSTRYSNTHWFPRARLAMASDFLPRGRSSTNAGSRRGARWSVGVTGDEVGARAARELVDVAGERVPGHATVHTSLLSEPPRRLVAPPRQPGGLVSQPLHISRRMSLWSLRIRRVSTAPAGSEPAWSRPAYASPASARGRRPHAKRVSYQPVIGVSVVPRSDECTIQPDPT